MDIWSILTIVGATVTVQTLLIIAIGNKFLKFAFGKVQELITGPTISKAFGILGGKSGESRRNKALETEIADSVIQSTIGKWKLPLSIIGVDLDDLIERYGPMEILGAINTFLPMLKGAGIDISALMGQATAASNVQPQSSNTELGL